jgi:MFS transporter, SP family, sugar:H+ symporter
LGSKVFFIWGGFCCVCMAFVYFCIYETKGLSLEQVDELYAKVSSARKSPGFVPTVNFVDVKEMGATEARRSTLADLEMATARRKSSVQVQAEYLHKANYISPTATATM